MVRKSARTMLLACIALLALLPSAVLAGTSSGQTLYVPCYPYIYHGNKPNTFDLTVTLSVRNTDLKRSFTLRSVDYYDSEGKLVRSILQKPQTIGPLMTKEFVLGESDRSGGSGANFIVRWSSDTPVNAPIVEAIMIGTSSGQGVSFSSAGQPIQE